MRHAIASLVLALFLFPSLAMGDSVKYGDLVERDGLYYKKFTDVPFTGQTTGQIQGSFKDGKKDGPWIRYFETGQLRDKGDYKNGERDGPWVWYYQNGQLHYKGTYKNGKKEGPWVGYDEDGTVWEFLTGTYKDDKKVK